MDVVAAMWNWRAQDGEHLHEDALHHSMDFSNMHHVAFDGRSPRQLVVYKQPVTVFPDHCCFLEVTVVLVNSEWGCLVASPCPWTN